MGRGTPCRTPISIEFFKKNAWLLLLITVAVIAMIGLRYETKTKMSKNKITHHRTAESRKPQAAGEIPLHVAHPRNRDEETGS